MKTTWTLDELKAPKNKPVYVRQKKIPPPPAGVSDLKKVLLDMARDIKIIRRTQDIDSATAWANEFNAKHGTNYEAVIDDLNNDNIPEVIVRNKDDKNQLITINGYTTVPSSWPDTLMYGNTYPYDYRRKLRKDGEIYPNKDEWIRGKFNNVKSSISNPFVLDTSKINKNRYDEFGGVDNLISKGYKIKDYSQKERYSQSAYQAFNKYVFTPVFKGIKESLSKAAKALNNTTFERDWSFVFPTIGSITKACADSYQALIIIPVVEQIVGPEAAAVMNDSSAFNRLKSKSAYKKLLKSKVQEYINHMANAATTGNLADAEDIKIVIRRIYENNEMIAKIGFIDPSNEANYIHTVDEAALIVIKEYNNFIMEAVYYQQPGSPKRPSRKIDDIIYGNPNAAMGEEDDTSNEMVSDKSKLDPHL